MPRIRTVVLRDGRKRYEFTVDEPRGPGGTAGQLRPDQLAEVIAALADAAGYRRGAGDPDRAESYAALGRDLQAAKDLGGRKRKQIMRRFATRREATAELARITHQGRTGEYVPRSKVTVADVIDAYLRAAAFERQEATRLSYRGALEPVRERLGHRLAQSVDRDDIEALRDWMLTAGRRRGGKPGTPLSARSVRLTLGRLSAAFEQAVMDKRLAHNPARYVKMPRQAPSERATWSQAQVRTFLAAAAADRLHAAWRLTLFGARRSEVCALRWDDVDLIAGTVTIGRARVLVGGKVVEKPPKSERGYRTLPLTAADVAALQALRKRQAAEKLAAGTAYTGSGYVVTDELGAAVHPDWYSDEFHRVAARAGLPRIRAHDARHTVNSLMAAAGVPDHIRAAWCGHTVAVNTGTYTHARPEDLAIAQAALAKISGVT